MPSTGSIFAKPIKECMVARPGYVSMSSDFAALEDRVLANMTKDEGKLKLLKVYPDGSMYDGHCFNATAYYRSKVEAELGPSDDSIEFNKRFKDACETNKTLKAIRQDSKGPTFGLALTTGVAA